MNGGSGGNVVTIGGGIVENATDQTVDSGDGGPVVISGGGTVVNVSPG